MISIFSVFSLKEKTILCLLASIQFCHIVDFVIMMPLGPQLMRTLSISPGQFSLLIASYNFSAGFSSLLNSFYIDSFDRKQVLIFFFIGFIIGTFCCGISNNYSTLLFFRTLTGSFGGVIGSVIFSIVGDLIHENKRGRAFGIIMAAFSIASILGVPAGLYLSSHLGWSSPFIVLTGISTFIIICVYFFIPSVKTNLEQTSNIAEHFLCLIKNSKIQLGLILIAFLVLGQFTVVPFISPSLVANVGITEDQLPWLYFIGGSFTIFSSPLIGFFSDKIGKKQVFYFFAIISLLPLWGVTHLEHNPMTFVFFITTSLFICMGGQMIPAMALLNSIVDSKKRGSFMSLVSATQQFASSLASYIAGWLLIQSAKGELLHYPILGYLAMFFTVMAIIATFTLNKQISSENLIKTSIKSLEI